MSALEAQKRALRAQIRDHRRALDPAAAEASSERIQRHLFSDPRWKNAQRIALYSAMPGEVATDLLLERARAEGKSVAWPRVVETALRFHEAALLTRGKLGFLEPPESAPVVDALDLIVVPCVACDRSGARLGRGGGHYDATLPRMQSMRAGLCFAWQLVERVPAGPHDAGLDLVVTEDGVIECERRGP